jgi:hypothetical protein
MVREGKREIEAIIIIVGGIIDAYNTMFWYL